MAIKALFFLRHYNDIDHITPIIYKWIVAGHQCDVVLIGAANYRNDFRINFLSQQKQARVTHIREVFTLFEYVKWRLQMYLLTGNVRRLFFGPLVALIAKIYDAKKREQLWRYIAGKLLTRSFAECDGGVVTFDWIERNSVICVEWVEIVIEMAKTMGLSVVSLPHGDSPHANQLIRSGEWKVGPDNVFSTACMFDKLVVPNELCAKRFRPFFNNQEIAVLGSPRFCAEWLPKLAEILPSSPLACKDNRLKIVMFLRKANFTTFWEEVGEVVHLVAAFSNVTLILKPHTRSGWKQPFTKNRSIKRLTNVSVADDAIHSAHLMDWSDVIIDLATSVVFEAVRAKKPVLAADYLHAGRSAIAFYMPETELRCRDDVYMQIQNFLSVGCDSFYNEKNRQRFLHEMLDVKGENVLSRYVDFLKNVPNV